MKVCSKYFDEKEDLVMVIINLMYEEINLNSKDLLIHLTNNLLNKTNNYIIINNCL